VWKALAGTKHSSLCSAEESGQEPFCWQPTAGYCRVRKYTQELYKNTEFLTNIKSDTESSLSTNSNKDGKLASS